MRTFVEDIVVLILDSQTWWQRDFPRLARISSSWLQPVRKRLYACPTLSSYRACHRLARTLVHNPTLIPLVRALDLRPTNAEWTCEAGQEYDYDTDMSMRAAVPRLLAFLRLERLTLAGDLAEGAERFLRSVASPHSITALRIEGTRGALSEPQAHGLRDPLASLEWSTELAERFHALKSLALVGPLMIDVDNSGYDAHDERLAPIGVRCCMLEELHLDAIVMAPMSGGLFSLLSSPAAWQRLRTLSIASDDFLFELNCFYLIALLGTSLESLTFQSRIGGSAPPFTHVDEDAIVGLTSLSALSTTRNVRLLDVNVSPSWLRELADTFSDVEDLEVSEVHAAKISLDAWARFIGSLSLRRLKTLTLGESSFKRWGHPSSPESAKALEDACAARGIELHRGTKC
ncbi:hypothetical protein M0805_000433 [Coniferiporia weirii]|nr:hypothetical protein M0805_000433 [Coniferiporia weirii]